MALNYKDMANAMETALEKEWFAVKGENLPGAGLEYRQLLFKAISRGALRYLETHQDDIFNSIALQYGSGSKIRYNVSALDLNTKSGT